MINQPSRVKLRTKLSLKKDKWNIFISQIDHELKQYKIIIQQGNNRT